MTDRETRLLTAAFNVFSRYGVSKTTVSDIAAEAGVSRQTMYNMYGGRDEILRAVVAFVSEQNRSEVMTAWDAAETLDEKLSIFCEAGPLAWYDMIHASAHAADLIEGLNLVAKEQMEVSDAAWVAALADQIETHASQGTGAHSAHDIADLFYVAAAQAKYRAETRAVLETRLGVLKRSILALLDIA